MKNNKRPLEIQLFAIMFDKKLTDKGDNIILDVGVRVCFF